MASGIGSTRLSPSFVAALERIAAEAAEERATRVPTVQPPSMGGGGVVPQMARDIWTRLGATHKLWEFWLRETRLPQYRPEAPYLAEWNERAARLAAEGERLAAA